MFWLILSFTLIEGTSLINSEPTCKRFKTVEVLQRFYWARTSIPWTTEEAERKGWNKISTKEKFHLDIYRFQQVNNFFIFYYKNNLVGVGPTYKCVTASQGVIYPEQRNDGFTSCGLLKESFRPIKSKLKNSIKRFFNYLVKQYLFTQTVTVNEIMYRYALILFVDPAILKGKGEVPCSWSAIYFEGRQAGRWIQLPILESQIKSKNIFMDKQGCLNRFGNYYFYRLNNSTKCTEIHGFYSFYDNHGDMVGFGVFYPGSEILSEDNTHPHPVYRLWRVDEVKEIVPHNKKCITKEPAKGYTSIDIFIQPKTEVHFKCRSKDDKLI